MHKKDSQKGISKNILQITLDEKTHTYSVNGLKLPSVSEIMKTATEEHYATIPTSTLEKAADRGKRVHKSIEMFELYGIEPEDEEVKPYFMQYKIAKHLEQFEITECELMMTNGEYCGTIDAYAKVKGQETLIDFKVTSIINENLLEIQLAAYDKLLIHNGRIPMGHYCLQLKKDGYKFKAIRPNEMLWEDFLDKYRAR